MGSEREISSLAFCFKHSAFCCSKKRIRCIAIHFPVPQKLIAMQVSGKFMPPAVRPGAF